MWSAARRALVGAAGLLLLSAAAPPGGAQVAVPPVTPPATGPMGAGGGGVIPDAGGPGGGLPPGDTGASALAGALQNLPPSFAEKARTFSLGEFFWLGPDPVVGPIKRTYVSRERIVQVFEPERNSGVVRAYARGLGVVQVTLEGQNGKYATFIIRIAPSLDYLRVLLRQQFPLANVRLSAAGDNILIVDGTVEAPGDADAILTFLEGFVERGVGRVINRIKVTGVMQVQLQVCIAKVDRNASRQLGVNLLRSELSNFEGIQTGNLIGVPSIAARGGTVGTASGVFTNFTGTGTNPVLTPQSTVFFGITPHNVNFFAFIEALKQEGVAKILATPTLVTLNGRPADFLVGGEQPVPVVTGASGSLLPSIDYKAFGTRLTFVPTILGDGKIRLNVVPEVSTLNFANAVLVAGTSVPQFETQRVNATVEMESGQTLALGGLLQTEEAATVSKVPVLGDLPGAGVLFRRVNHTKTETELLIVVTPVLVDPLRGCQRPPALPGQESRTPNDCELYLKGRIEVPADQGAPAPPAGIPAPLPEPAPMTLPQGVVPVRGAPR
jgi:pilus assembly protein CpaC